MLLGDQYKSINSWARNLEKDSWGKSIATRAVKLPFIPGFLATGVIDGVVGSVSGFAAIIFSKNLGVWSFSMSHLDGCRKTFANSYVSLMGAAIAVFAVPLSLIFCGRFESLNNLAYRTLQATGIVQDIVYGTAKFFNPWAGIKANT